MRAIETERAECPEPSTRAVAGSMPSGAEWCAHVDTAIAELGQIIERGGELIGR
jgi:hypothetical protein